MQILDRNIENKLRAALKISPVVFLNGPRQAGKSTVAQKMLKLLSHKNSSAEYVSFDKPVQMAAASAEPENFLRQTNNLLIIDEVQMVPEIFRALKVVVDDLRCTSKQDANGKFLLTGSANIMALPQLANSLVGRMSILTLYPFSVPEANSLNSHFLERLMENDFPKTKKSTLSLQDAIQSATYPEIFQANADERTIWFDGYITTLLQRDVRMIAELEKLSTLPNLLRILASRAGSLINEADLARCVNLIPMTAKTYRTVLQSIFLTFNIQPWYRNIGKRFVKSPKGYLTDTLLLCHLLGINLPDLKKAKPEYYGHVIENFVASELLKQLSYSDIKATLYHFRTSDGKEVDFVLEQPNGQVFGIEVKCAENITAADFKGLHALAESALADFQRGIILYMGNTVVPFGKNMFAVPIEALWQ